MKFTDDYLLYLMAQASAAISAEFHGWLEGEGVSVADWRVMGSLYPDAALTVGELAASCMVKQPTMTRMVDRLVARGIVERGPGEGDRRRVAVRLTGHGRVTAARLVREAKAHEAKVLARFGGDAGALKTLLRDLADVRTKR